MVALVVAGGWSSRAAADVRSVQISYRYPAVGNYAGVALYHAASLGDIDQDSDLTRVDLGLLPVNNQGIVNVMVPGFDDARDYYVVLRTYDAGENESRNSNVGVVKATEANPALLFAQAFESASVGSHPDPWVDSPGGSNLFEVAELGDGTHALAAPGSTGEVQSHVVIGQSLWASYELRGAIASETLAGSAGVTFLSRYPG